MSAAIKTNLWLPRLAALAVGVLLAASVTFWALKLSAPNGLVQAPVAASRDTPTRPMTASDPAALAAFLGASPAAALEPTAAAPSPWAGRFVLTGVVAGASSQGVAVIAVDGQAPRPYRVGTRVDDGLVLQSVAPRKAVLAAGPRSPALLTLELPPLPKP